MFHTSQQKLDEIEAYAYSEENVRFLVNVNVVVQSKITLNFKN